MTTPGWMRIYRALFAMLALVAIAWQFSRGGTGPGARAANFFSYFTIEGNLFAAVVFLWGASGDADRRPASVVSLVRGAAVLYMSVTGVVYGLLLDGYQQELQTTLPWVNTVVHQVMPLVLVADWLLDPPRGRLTVRRALIWLAYPLLYAAYSLIRGPIADWYPYPFLDPDRVGGYGVVALYCVGIALGTLLFAWLVVIAGRCLRLIAATA